MISLALALALAAPSPLVGAWAFNGAPFVTLSADGTCSMAEEACTWRADKTTLFITGGGQTDTVPYALQGGVLTLVVGGFPMALQKVGGAPAVAAPPPAQAAPAPPMAAPKAGKVNVKDPLAALLLSSPWCTFHYNKNTGYSSTTRVQWFADGTYQIGGRSEGYSSGAGGTFASQHDTGSTGKWTVEKGMLMATPPPSDANPMPTQFVAVPLAVTRNSNGYPIITSQGDEYSQCN